MGWWWISGDGGGKIDVEGITAEFGDLVVTVPNSTPRQLSIYRYRRTNKSYTEDLGNGVTLTLMLIPAGEFIMGAPEDEPKSSGDERPQHRVRVALFLMGRYPVTQAQWRVVAGYDRENRDLDPNPSHFKGDNRPIETVRWDDAQEFCQRLSKQTGKDYRLPSEAQWEYACRAGTETPFHFGETILPELANYNTAFSYKQIKFSGIDYPTIDLRGTTTEVGIFPANHFGLHDMHGNVWEWCEDDYHSSYEGAPTDGSAWIEDDYPAWGSATHRTRTRRVLRGGSWNYNPGNCRSADRNGSSHDNYDDYIGFRVCCVPRSPI